ncbi:MAG: hypothetical protein Q8M22_10135 [Actinomycetota bacterium]|nr:hypothetical protein [Actinomycetota bacterium]
MNTDQMHTDHTIVTTTAPGRGRHPLVVFGATAMVAVAASTAFVRLADDPAPRPTTRADHAQLRDLVNRGIVPRAALDTAALSEDEMLRDLVNRGIVPRRALPD